MYQILLDGSAIVSQKTDQGNDLEEVAAGSRLS
jgi:hypothetical protein